MSLIKSGFFKYISFFPVVCFLSLILYEFLYSLWVTRVLYMYIMQERIMYDDFFSLLIYHNAVSRLQWWIGALMQRYMAFRAMNCALHMNVAAINRAFGSRHVCTGDECYDNVVEFHGSEVLRPGNIMREIRALREILQRIQIIQVVYFWWK